MVGLAEANLLAVGVDCCLTMARASQERSDGLEAPGGRLVLSEPDHGSHLVATSEFDVFERITGHRRNAVSVAVIAVVTAQ